MNSLITGLSKATHVWSDPGLPCRKDAVQATLTASNSFTEEALEFAIDQQMSEVTKSALMAWIGGRRPKRVHQVGVINAGNVPFAGLQDLLAVILCDHSYVGVLSSKSPYLLPAFVQTVRDQGVDLGVNFVDHEAVWRQAQAVMATGSDSTIAQISSLATIKGLPQQKCLFRSNRYGVSILDGRETDHDLDDLALDVLLHEGMGCRNVALIFAPAGLEPDQCLEHLARVRGIFPAHPSTPGRLEMQRAYLAAVKQSHAYGDGLEFLVSKGPPEVQVPGHVRWVEYEDLDEVIRFVEATFSEVQCVVARDRLCEKLPETWDAQPLGTTQKPALAWKPDGRDTIDFLCNL
ncbi:MAG: hypothetical protein F4Z16_05285 [Rhodothermaceae bacterium]|nr:hypothetical protein [Rhodothermaceae bacterium]MXZ57879.1 hypothetical protein [Rhodothermaceae bacterium]MYB91822.1 hypothetical protein [Rhodothermaceae bacterium]MYG43889.1 hypothetical protein [Rhodothermaceae bacterium]MYG69203.1 hypothetical protein [Rhodothermaceae bacterium]